MSLDDAAYPALWRINAETGIKPEWLLPVLFLESGFRPDIQNQAGEPFYGINQASVSLIQQFANTDPQTYLTWPASQQLNTVVIGYLSGLVRQYGPLRSAVRVYQGNFLPSTLNTARKLGDVITASPSAFYTHNAGLDADKNGAITVSDLATYMAREARQTAVQIAIRGAYASRDAGSMTLRSSPDPTNIDHIVYGDDFNFYDRNQAWIVGGAILIGAVAVSYYIRASMGPRPRRNR